MSLAPPRLDFTSNKYLTVYFTPTSSYLSDPSSIHSIHAALTHVGPVGVLHDVQIVSVPKDDWDRVSGEILAAFRDKADVVRVEVQDDPKARRERAPTWTSDLCRFTANQAFDAFFDVTARYMFPAGTTWCIVLFSHVVVTMVSESIASPSFLSYIKSLYPASSDNNPWYVIAAVGFAACNRPEAIPMVFQYAMEDLQSSSHDDKLLLVRRMRDAILKGGMLNGYPKAINGLKSLFDVTPEELRDHQMLRDPSRSASEIDERGRQFYRQTYGDTADAVQSLLDEIYPDMGWFSNFVGYGIVYAFDDVLTGMETSYVLVTALIATDTPRQINWHLKGAMRNGATREKVQAVRAMAIEIAKESGIVWRNEIPDVSDDT